VAQLASGIRWRRAASSTWAVPTTLVERPSPTDGVRESIQISRRLLAGQEVQFEDFPILRSYFHIRNETRFRLQFQPRRPVSFWIPPKGPRMLRLAAEQCDGVLFNTYTQFAALPFIRDGSLQRTLAEIAEMRSRAGNTSPLRRIFKLDISLDEDGEAARRFAKNFVSFNAADDAEHYRKLGLPADQLEALRTGYHRRSQIAEVAPLAGSELVDWVVLAGTPAEVADRFAEYVDCADRLGFEQIIFAVPLGPNPPMAIQLASQLVSWIHGKPRRAAQG